MISQYSSCTVVQTSNMFLGQITLSLYHKLISKSLQEKHIDDTIKYKAQLPDSTKQWCLILWTGTISVCVSTKLLLHLIQSSLLYLQSNYFIYWYHVITQLIVFIKYIHDSWISKVDKWYYRGILSLRYSNRAAVPFASIFALGWRNGFPLNCRLLYVNREY